MGNFKETITLVNLEDRSIANRGFMPESSVRQLTVDALVDTGASTLVIDRETCRKLGLAIVKKRWTLPANGMQEECGVTESVTVHWKDRFVDVRATVVPGAKMILLGAFPLEGMDLMVDTKHHRLVGVHGDGQLDLAL